MELSLFGILMSSDDGGRRQRLDVGGGVDHVQAERMADARRVDRDTVPFASRAQS
jgi:hypothetical protein